MNQVIAFPGTRRPVATPSRDPAYDRFCRSRGDMLEALRLWLLSRPDEAVVADELAVTASAGRQLRDLLVESDPA